MVEEGTWAWLEVGDSDLFAGPLPENVRATVFANRQLFVVLANYGPTDVEIQTTASYAAAVDASAATQQRWKLAKRSPLTLRRTV